MLVSRRQAVVQATTAMATIALGGQTEVARVAFPPGGQDARRPGAPASPIGDRAPGEQPRRAASTSTSQTPLQDLHGSITPSDLHYEVHHAGVPQIDASSYGLLIHGLVERPTVFTLEELKRMPSESRVCFLECAGNYARNAPASATPQTMAGLTSQTEWTGVPLRSMFREVGVKPDASWFLAEGQDGAALDRSIPVRKAWEDAMLAYAQNGEALRPAQGYPVRLLLPGWEGNTNVKWLRRIELSDRPFMTRWETSRYSDGLPGGKIRQFSFVMDARSIVTHPASPARLGRGWHEIRGLAWSGRGKIVRVEVSVDDGTSWRPAELQGPVVPMAHTRFRLMWRWDGAESVVSSRAIDETGYVQPTLAELLRVRGADTGPYHINPIVSWRVPSSGVVELRQDRWP